MFGCAARCFIWEISVNSCVFTVFNVKEKMIMKLFYEFSLLLSFLCSSFLRAKSKQQAQMETQEQTPSKVKVI